MNVVKNALPSDWKHILIKTNIKLYLGNKTIQLVNNDTL